MTDVSSPELARAACEHGAIGSFPAHNAAGEAELSEWLERANPDPRMPAAPLAVNLVVHRSNGRLAADLGVIAERKVELVIASVGSPAPVVDTVHAAGGRVFADVASLRHAERAIATGVDGLVLLCAGAGGQTGWLNPFAFARAVRARFDGTIVLAGAIGDGASIRAAEVLGADLVFMGTRFIATTESAAPNAYKQAVLDSSADEVVLSDRLAGLPTSLLARWLEQHDPTPAGREDPARADGGAGGGFDQERLLAHRDAWSAGHAVGAAHALLPAAELIARLREEYTAAGRA
jgi:nitronate monooxygenase